MPWRGAWRRAGRAPRRGQGRPVGIAARNSANWIVAYMAVLMAGGCATLLNGWWLGEELAEAIELAGCTLVLADPERPRGSRTGSRRDASRCSATANPSTVRRLLDAHRQPARLPHADRRRPGDDACSPRDRPARPRAPGRTTARWSRPPSTIAAQTLMFLTIKTERGEPAAGQPGALVAVPLFHVTGEVPLFLQSFIIGRKLALMPKWNALEAMR
jgi:acyl-CoA synthetase (AMP-forming)/AMP-acid ligase II